jgi:hypothetical protein
VLAGVVLPVIATLIPFKLKEPVGVIKGARLALLKDRDAVNMGPIT